MGKKQFILFMAAVCVLFSCEKNMTDTGYVPMPCDGNIAISFSAGATKSGDLTELTEDEKKAGLADGSLFTDLWLWVVHDGTKELRYFAHITDAIDAVDHYEYRFERVERGNYTLYAVANYSNKLDRFDPYIPEHTYKDQSGKDVTNPKLPWKDAIGAEFTKFTLAEIEDDGLGGLVPPTVAKNDGRMPLSIIRKFSVAAGDNYIQAAMTRVCGRLSITVRNLSPDYKIAISDLKLSERNPKSAYLFQDNHDVPDALYNPFYDRFVKFRKDEGKGYAMIQPMQESEILSQLMYETGQDISIGLEICGAVFKADSDEDPEVKDSETVTRYSVGSAEGPSDGKNYVLSPLSTANVMHVSGSDINMVSLTDGDSDGYYTEEEIGYSRWTYSGSSTSGTLVNVGCGKGLIADGRSLSVSLPSSNITTWAIASNGEGHTISLDGYGLGFRYYLQGDDNSVSIGYVNSVNDTRRWQFLPVTSSERKVPVTPTITNGDKQFSYKTDAINVLDQYGASVPLTHICRNQDVRIILNVSYNPVSGTFDYVIEPWEERNMGAEFD